ncbi:MAG: glutamate-5-semialdehyde dehydrogenase [Polyangiales bacterium]
MNNPSNIDIEVRRLGERAKLASQKMAIAPTEKKNAVLRRIAAALRSESAVDVLRANEIDVKNAERDGLSAAMIDRLRLDRARLDGVAKGLDQVAQLPDPVGETLNHRVLENGLSIAQMRVPLGVIAMIYESRPAVTVDAAALCLKSGNAVILRGGKEAYESNRAFAAIVENALNEEGLPADAVLLIPTIDRQATTALIRLDGLVDVVIPRGGEGLINFVAKNATVPVLNHYKGVCHVYVDAEANLDDATAIVLNSKVQRPGVCNAMETLLVDEAIAETYVPQIVAALVDHGVEVRADDRVRALSNGRASNAAPDFDAEYLDLICNLKIVDGIDGALDHVRKHGSQHTEAILTENRDRQTRWLREVDASFVVTNASTRFNDGFQLGLGAEIGISTTKLHAYGPMGLQELCALKWIGEGQGQIRQ